MCFPEGGFTAECSLQHVKVSVVCFRFLLKFITSFIYVICFLFSAVPNFKHATSNFPFLLFNLIYFLWKCSQTHLGVLRSCRLCAPLRSDWFWPWEWASLRSCGKWLPISILDLGNAIPLFHWVNVGHTETEWYAVVLWCCRGTFFKNNFVFWNNVRFVENYNCQENTQSFQTFLTHFLPIVNILHYHSTFVRTNKSALLQYY